MEIEVLARRIAEARKAAKIGRPELAWRLKCSVQLVEAWERGERNPAANLHRLDLLAEALGHPVSWFFEVSPDSETPRAA